eukprot:967110-Rhodomonas_salina.1
MAQPTLHPVYALSPRVCLRPSPHLHAPISVCWLPERSQGPLANAWTAVPSAAVSGLPASSALPRVATSHADDARVS